MLRQNPNPVDPAVLSLPMKKDYQVNTLEDADYLFNRIFGFPRPDFPDRRQVCLLYMDENMMLKNSKVFYVSELKSIKNYLREMMFAGLNCDSRNIFLAHYSPFIHTDEEGATELLCDTYNKLVSAFDLAGFKIMGYVFYDDKFRRIDIDLKMPKYFI